MICKRIQVTMASAAFAALTLSSSFGQSAGSDVINRELQSDKFAQNKVGVSSVRRLAIYLPPSYSQSVERYPVIYFLPTPFENYRAPFDQHGAQALFDRAIAAGVIDKFILVSVDMTTPLGCSWYVNSPVTGNWEDFVIRDLTPYIDANFRTLARRDSRGIAGEFMGAYGAIRFGMRHPDVFGSVYGLHPVGTGSGVLVMYSRPDWDLLARARSLDEIRKDNLSSIFMTIFQAFLPDPDRPPLFIDFQAVKTGGRLVVDAKQTERLRAGFFLESIIPEYAENLKSLRAFKFDWARNDANHDHVYANQAFTHKLDEFAIPHQAEEYNGLWSNGPWTEGGRVEAEVLPFFAKYLAFDWNAQPSRNAPAR